MYFFCAVDPERQFSDAVSAVFDSVGARQAAIDVAQTVVDRCVSRGMAASTAELTGADLVVMATHGRSGLRRALLGSVAESVGRQSPVAVLLVPALLPASDPSRREKKSGHRSTMSALLIPR